MVIIIVVITTWIWVDPNQLSVMHRRKSAVTMQLLLMTARHDAKSQQEANAACWTYFVAKQEKPIWAWRPKVQQNGIAAHRRKNKLAAPSR